MEEVEVVPVVYFKFIGICRDYDDWVVTVVAVVLVLIVVIAVVMVVVLVLGTAILLVLVIVVVPPSGCLTIRNDVNMLPRKADPWLGNLKTNKNQNKLFTHG